MVGELVNGGVPVYVSWLQARVSSIANTIRSWISAPHRNTSQPNKTSPRIQQLPSPQPLIPQRPTTGFHPLRNTLQLTVTRCQNSTSLWEGGSSCPIPTIPILRNIFPSTEPWSIGGPTVITIFPTVMDSGSFLVRWNMHCQKPFPFDSAFAKDLRTSPCAAYFPLQWS